MTAAKLSFRACNRNRNRPSEKKEKLENGRGDRIRTCDILLPKQARYRAALLPEPLQPLGITPAESKHKAL